MAIVIRKEFVTLLDLVINKFELVGGVKLVESVTKDQFFENLSIEIKKSTKIEIKKSTLYKSYYLDLNKSKEDSVKVSDKYANALSLYYNNEYYSTLYSIQLGRNIDYFAIKDDPEMPEYPVENPGFPATPSIPILFDVHKSTRFLKYIKLGIENVSIDIKDESKNKWAPNIKSRAAWEIFLYAKENLQKGYDSNKIGTLFKCCILTSGNFALAVFVRLMIQGINFQLRVILDLDILNSNDSSLSHKKKELEIVINISEMYPRQLKIYRFPIDSKELSSKDIFAITKSDPNDSFDLTFGGGIDNFQEIKGNYYDWFSYEILSQSPDCVFTPFGEGNILKGILDKLILEINNPKLKKTKRYFGNDNVLKYCDFYGLTSIKKTSPLDKLYVYSDFHPMFKFESNLSKYYDRGYKGDVFIKTEDDFLNDGELNGYLKDAKEIFDQYGINSEPSGRAGMALFLKEFEKDPRSFFEKKVLIINTGYGNWEQTISSEKFKKIVGDL